MKVVIGEDTAPNKWYVKYAKGGGSRDSRSLQAPELFVKLYNQPPQLAWRTCCAFHTSGQAFGKIMSSVKPRHAVAYHFFSEEATRYSLYDNIRATYEGPLSMATDMMVWNISKNNISERMAVSPEDAWDVPGEAVRPSPEKGRRNQWILKGRWDVSDVQEKMLDGYADKYILRD